MQHGICLCSSLYDVSSPNHIVNKLNIRGQSPLYAAALNGHVNIIKLLIKFGANPMIKSHVDHKNTESLLDVCARWNHIDCFEYLLKSIKWSIEYLQKVKKHCKGTKTKSLLKKYTPNQLLK